MAKAKQGITSTVQKLLAARQVLAALDGYDKAVGDKVIRGAYDFAPLTCLALAKIGNRLNSMAETADAARRAIAQKHVAEGKSEIDPRSEPAAFAAFSTEWEAVLNSEDTLDVAPLTLADLKLEVNAIPTVQVLVPLMAAGVVVE